jgi:hypothetical protein
MSDGTEAGNPDSIADGGQASLVADLTQMATAGSVYTTSFTADGTNDVVFRYAPYTGVLGDAVHNQIWGINGFQLVPEPATSVLFGMGGLMMLALRRRRS